MNNIRRQIYYGIAAIMVGFICAAFLVSVAKRVPAGFSVVIQKITQVRSAIAVSNRNSNVNANENAIGKAENPALAKNMTPQQKQAIENLDLDAEAPVTYLKPHKVTASQYLVIDLTEAPSAQIPTSSTSASKVKAQPFVLADRTILAKDAARAVPIASITKLVTAVVTQNILDLNAPVEITPKIMNTDGNTAGFRVGEKFSTSELLNPLLMVSSNDAAEALAQSDPKGRGDFIRTMNQWAQSIGAYHTYFADPTGLSPENVSNANDLSIIMRWIYNNRPDLIAITDTKVRDFRVHRWTNPTQLLNLSSYLGGKNGYIPQSGETAVSLFEAGNKLFAVVVLGSSNRDQDILELMHEATGVAYITYERIGTANAKN